MIYNHTLSGYQKRFQAFLDVVKFISVLDAIVFILFASMSFLSDSRMTIYYIVTALIVLNLPGMIANRFKKLFFFCLTLFTSAAIVLVFSNIETLRELPVKVVSLRLQTTTNIQENKNYGN